MLGINLTPLLASATIIGATLGFGAQQIIRDYLSGFLLTVEDQFSVGDSITVDGTGGVVEDVTMRVTRVRGLDGTIYFVPNGDIRLLANTSRAGPAPRSTSPCRGRRGRPRRASAASPRRRPIGWPSGPSSPTA